MKRFIAGAFSAALLLAGLAITAPPALAHPDTCTGSGTASTNPVFHPTLGPSATGSVTFTFVVGGCVLSGTTTFNGAFSGSANYCGNSTGRVTLDGHLGNWVSVGSVWVFTGAGLAGVLNVDPDALAGQSCVSGATSFRWTGSIETI